MKTQRTQDRENIFKQPLQPMLKHIPDFQIFFSIIVIKYVEITLKKTLGSMTIIVSVHLIILIICIYLLYIDI